MAQPHIPQPMTLSALQTYVAGMVEARGFTRDPNQIFILLVEELGELATEFKHWIYYPERFDRRNLAYELADLLMYLVDLANCFAQDLPALWVEHEQANDQRFAPRRAGRAPEAAVSPGFTLNQMAAHVETKRRERNFEDTPERLVILLTEEVGEIATEIRKHWKGMSTAHQIGLEVIDALTYLFRLGYSFQVDLEVAVVEKEQENASRVWSY